MKTFLLLIALSLAGCSQKADRQPQQPSATDHKATKPHKVTRPKLTRTEPLPQLARQMLRDSMREHGDDMENLFWTVLMLDYDSTVTLAKAVGRSPKLSRPPPSEDPNTLNAQLPSAFFDLQDDLFRATDALAAAATARDDAAIAKRFAELNDVCVRCHALYLKIPGEVAGN
jgi:hypothetical protein